VRQDRPMRAAQQVRAPQELRVRARRPDRRRPARPMSAAATSRSAVARVPVARSRPARRKRRASPTVAEARP
jgi:hypothetical protein